MLLLVLLLLLLLLLVLGPRAWMQQLQHGCCEAQTKVVSGLI
jgi:competence protein ComGC